MEHELKRILRPLIGPRVRYSRAAGWVGLPPGWWITAARAAPNELHGLWIETRRAAGPAIPLMCIRDANDWRFYWPASLHCNERSKGLDGTLSADPLTWWHMCRHELKGTYRPPTPGVIRTPSRG